MVESKVVKLRTVGDRECLSLPKEEAKDGDAINNRTKSDLEVKLSQVFMGSLTPLNILL